MRKARGGAALQMGMFHSHREPIPLPKGDAAVIDGVINANEEIPVSATERATCIVFIYGTEACTSDKVLKS